MKCPKCESTELRKSDYAHHYACPNCKGQWLQAGELAHGTEDSSEAPEGSGDNPEHDARTGLCPGGHGIMLRARVDLAQPFYLERCSVCGGIWFDGGEWQRVVENDLLTNLPNLWSRAWQRNQRIIQNREDFLQANLQLLGEEIFASIMQLAGLLNSHPEKSRAIALLQEETNARTKPMTG